MMSEETKSNNLYSSNPYWMKIQVIKEYLEEQRSEYWCDHKREIKGEPYSDEEKKERYERGLMVASELAMLHQTWIEPEKETYPLEEVNDPNWELTKTEIIEQYLEWRLDKAKKTTNLTFDELSKVNSGLKILRKSTYHFKP